jgi:hypothetical protein
VGGAGRGVTGRNMNITEFAFQLLIVGIPGITAWLLVGRISGRRKTAEKLDAFFQILVFSVLSYLLFSLLNSIWNWLVSGEFASDAFTNALRDVSSASVADIGGATVCALPVALAWAFISHKDLLNRLAARTGIAARFGCEDVWDYLFKRVIPKARDQWVYVRDGKLGVVYFGYISAYSEFGDERELIISDVSVFSNEDGKELYSVQSVYVSRDRDDLTIEIVHPMVSNQE